MDDSLAEFDETVEVTLSSPSSAILGDGVHTYTIINNDVPTSPVLALPSNGAADQDTSLTLQWGSSPTATTYHLQLTTDSNFTSLVVDDSSIVDTSHQVNALSRLTKYYWRLSAANAAGASDYSDTFSFTTIPPLPTAITAAATDVTPTTAKLHGLVNANNGTTTVVFAYGTTTSYGDTLTAAESPVTGTSFVSVNADNIGLTPSTLYHYNVTAASVAGTTTGDDETFTTLPLFAFTNYSEATWVGERKQWNNHSSVCIWHNDQLWGHANSSRESSDWDKFCVSEC